jgi:type VI secretion system protein ImpL
MFAFLKLRVLLIALGLMLLASFIWFAGPYFAFADYRPLEPANARLIAIALVVGLWAASVLIKRLRANRASDQLVAAVVRQSQADARPSAEALQLRERFEEAVATLKAKRRSGHSLYDLPWYVIIGAPGSGKTTALVNSGLRFPLDQRSGKGALRGVGGTRNCDWWFTDEAVLLDTAGRYTTQDSDASADSAAWAEFLALLKKYRKRRPVNGVILTISAQDLMVQSHGSLEAHVDAARRRLSELNKELRVQLPVYLMVTKCDLVAGFTEYFDDLTQEGRAQVWGVTFPYEQTLTGVAAQEGAAEFDALIGRLNERLLARLEEDHDPKRRARIFAFPQQMAALGEPLMTFVTDVFGGTRFDANVLLRGIYFTSGTQEGTPIDRLLGAIGRRFAIAPDAVVSTGSRGKAYFIGRLLTDVMFAESGLAGVNRRVEVQKAAVQLGAYAAMALVAVLGIVALSVSYSRNRTYVDEVAADVALLRQALAQPASSHDVLLPRLDAVRAVVDSADRHRGTIPWAMRWGLYQGNAIGDAARDAYATELNGPLLEQVAARIQQRLVTSAADPAMMFLYLKAYVMLGQPARLDKAFLGGLADLEWKTGYAADPDAAAAFSEHFKGLLDLDEKLRPVQVDQALIAQVRRSLPPDDIPRFIYGELKLVYERDTASALRLDGLGADQVFRSRKGGSLPTTVSSLYTRKVFEEIVSKSAADLEKEVSDDWWVLSDTPPSSTGSARLRTRLLEIYESDYIARWDAILDDIALVSFSSSDVDRAKRVLGTIAGMTSPLRSLLQTVDAHTYFPPDTPAPGGAISSVKGRLDRLLNADAAATGQSARPGARITAHFKPIHDLVAGEPGKAPIEGLLARIREIADKLGPGGGSGPLGGPDVASVAQVAQLSESLKRDASLLPPAVASLVSEAGDTARRVAAGGATSEIDRQYQQEVARRCTEAIAGRYPFVPTSQIDVQISDFSQLFGYGGAFDTFFKTRLQPLVNTTRKPWTWLTDASGASVGLRSGVLRQFEAAQQIREMFFPIGSNAPALQFVITPVFLDAQARRFRFELDGETLIYQHDAVRDKEFHWPGKTPGVVAASFEGGGGRTVSTQGPWAWFRFLDGRMQSEADGSLMVTVQGGDRQARLRVRPSSVWHPFGKRDLQNFRCEP